MGREFGGGLGFAGATRRQHPELSESQGYKKAGKKGEPVTITEGFLFPLRLDKVKYHLLETDVPPLALVTPFACRSSVTSGDNLCYKGASIYIIYFFFFISATLQCLPSVFQDWTL